MVAGVILAVGALRSFTKIRMVKRIKIQNKLNYKINYFKNLSNELTKLTQCKFLYWDTSESLLKPEGIVLYRAVITENQECRKVNLSNTSSNNSKTASRPRLATIGISKGRAYYQTKFLKLQRYTVLNTVVNMCIKSVISTN